MELANCKGKQRNHTRVDRVFYYFLLHYFLLFLQFDLLGQQFELLEYFKYNFELVYGDCLRVFDALIFEAECEGLSGEVARLVKPWQIFFLQRLYNVH